MEGAVRVFAGEFNRSTITVHATDAGGPAYVVTPGGAWCHLMFLAGALTEVSGTGDMLRCRLADPTGAFDLVAGGGARSELSGTFKTITVPSFLTIVGRAQMFMKDGSCTLFVRPDSVMVVDRAVRDIWVIRTADLTLGRLERLAGVLRGQPTDPRTRTTVEHYRTTPEQLRELACMVESALSSVQKIDAAGSSPATPREIIIGILREKQGPRGILVEEVIALAGLRGVPADAAKGAIEALIRDDECYQPHKGAIKLL